MVVLIVSAALVIVVSILVVAVLAARVGLVFIAISVEAVCVVL